MYEWMTAFFDLSNAIVGFAVVQFLAFLFLVVTSEKLAAGVKKKEDLYRSVLKKATTGYVVLVWLCALASFVLSGSRVGWRLGSVLAGTVVVQTVILEIVAVLGCRLPRHLPEPNGSQKKSESDAARQSDWQRKE